MSDTTNLAEDSGHNLLKEDCISFAKAARRLPKVRGEKHLAPSTLYRWAMKGRRARDGKIIRLQTIRIGGTNCTSMEALERFFARLGGHELDSTDNPTKPDTDPSPQDKSVQKRVKRANEILRQRGVIK